MSNDAPQSLQIVLDATDPQLAEQQQRFNELVRDVAQWRAALAEWTDRIARHHQAVEPVLRDLHAAWREWVLALDHASLLPGLSRAERAQLGEMMEDAAREEHEPPHSEEERLEDLAEDWERQAAVAAAQREEWAAKRRTASASKRRRNEEQEVSRSVRDVYRRLASALHPDREPDAQQRERKTLLMQQANQAYADQNLLGLLELQLQAEQIDAAHLAGVDRRRLEHYVTVLREQLGDLQAETRRLEAEFRETTGLAPGAGLQPRKADRMITSEAQRLRAAVQSLRGEMRHLRDADSVRDWLREQRRATR
jgi:hypothetical protein